MVRQPSSFFQRDHPGSMPLDGYMRTFLTCRFGTLLDLPNIWQQRCVNENQTQPSVQSGSKERLLNENILKPYMMKPEKWLQSRDTDSCYVLLQCSMDPSYCRLKAFSWLTSLVYAEAYSCLLNKWFTAFWRISVTTQWKLLPRALPWRVLHLSDCDCPEEIPQLWNINT